MELTISTTLLAAARLLPSITAIGEPKPMRVAKGWVLAWSTRSANDFNLWQRGQEFALTLGVAGDGSPMPVDDHSTYVVDLSETVSTGELLLAYAHLSDGRMMLPVRLGKTHSRLPVRGQLAETLMQLANLRALALLVRGVRIVWRNPVAPRGR